MATATLTSKGQITVPKAIRDRLSLATGDRVRFFVDDEGRVVMVPATISIRSLRGCLPAPPRPLSLADMDKAVAQGAAGRARKPR
jgi:antitoxin PrlF